MLDNIEFFENRLIYVFHLRAATNYVFTTQFGQSYVLIAK